LNDHDLRVLRGLLDLIEQTNDPTGTVTVYTSDGYARIEVGSHNLDINAVRLLVGAAPLEADQVAAIKARHERGLL